jgi:CHASE1-domain containing sensor protein
MSERWLTVLAAVLGLLGGMAGAAVGGYVANQGQEQRFEHERETELRDLRIDTYVKFLRAAERERFQPVETDDRVVRTAEAEVYLVAPNEAIREAAADFANEALNFVTEAKYTRRREAFVDLAQAEIGLGE